MVVVWYRPKGTPRKRSHWTLEHHTLIVALALSLRLDAVVAYWFSLIALDATFSTRWRKLGLSAIFFTSGFVPTRPPPRPTQKDRRLHVLKHPVFVRFLMLGFFDGEPSLLTIVGDGSRGLKSSTFGHSGAIATVSISPDGQIQGQSIAIASSAGLRPSRILLFNALLE